MSRTHRELDQSRRPDCCRREGDTVADAGLDLPSRRHPPERTPSALKFGAAIHRSVETFYRARMKRCDTGMDEVLAAYLDAWEEPAEAPVSF